MSHPNQPDRMDTLPAVDVLLKHSPTPVQVVASWLEASRLPCLPAHAAHIRKIQCECPHQMPFDCAAYMGAPTCVPRKPIPASSRREVRGSITHVRAAGAMADPDAKQEG